MKSDVVRMFQTLPHPCGYYGERTAQNVVLDPQAPHLDRLFAPALEHGFRRAGGHLYRPQCLACSDCIACRVPVADFVPTRSQRRCERRNADLDVRLTAAHASPERFALYRRYLGGRHRDGGMDDPAPEDFERFLTAAWSPTRFVEFRQRDRLLAVAVTDVCASGLSAVYTFYDPDESARGLGTFAILSQVRLARNLGLAHLYLGYWIAAHPKMDYKARFRPLEIYREGRWQVLPEHAAECDEAAR